MRFISSLLLISAVALGSTDVVNRAALLYEHTDYQGSLRVLTSDKTPDAATWTLIGKNQFMLGDYAHAGESFKQAVALAPANAESVLWLGRTWGRKAEKANFIAAARNASEARKCFEKAVALDPSYREALNDLFSYYLEAPSIMGGGVDKAEAVARRTKPLSPAEYEYDEAQLALKRKDYAAAEGHFRRATDISPLEPGRVLDLARFLAKHGRPDESEALFERADQLAPGKPSILFARAQTYLETGRKPEEARRLLQEYLRSAITPDDPPRQTAEKMLRTAGSSEVVSRHS